MPFILLAGVAVCIYILVRMNRSARDKAQAAEGKVTDRSATPTPQSSGGADGEPGAGAAVAGEGASGEQAAGEVAAGELPQVTRAEMAEMIDSLIEQYEEEIREMTPAQQATRRESWETFEQTHSMTQMEFSEGVIARFWGFEPGSTPEIPNTKKLRLARGVWYTNPQNNDGTA